MRLCSLFSPFDCGLCLNCEAGKHASFLVPNGHFCGPLVSNVAVFVVPLVGCRQAGNHIDTDTFIGVRVQVPDLLFLVEVSDSQVPENRRAPMLSGFDWHSMGQLFEAHTLAVVPSDQVFPIEAILTSLGVVDDNARLFCEVDAENLGQVPACVIVMVAWNPNKIHFVCYFQGDLGGVFQHAESRAKDFCGPVVGRIDDRTFGRRLGREVIEVEKIMPQGDYDFLDGVAADMLGHAVNGSGVIASCNLQVVVVRARLLTPAEFAEVAIVQGELDQVRSVLGLSVPGLGGDRHLGDQAFDSLLDRLGSLAAELNGDLQVGDLPEGFDTVFADYLFSFSCHFPTVDFVLGDFPNVAIHFGMVEEFLDRSDLVSVVGQSPAVVA